MSRILSCCTAALWASVALPVIGAHAQTTTWEYTSVADSSGELALFSVPALNDAGQVAFVATFDDALEGQALYRAESNGFPTPIAITGGVESIRNFLGDPAINASGVVTFTATLDDDSVSVFTGSGGALVTIANTTTDGLTSIDSEPFISDTGGAVVVRAVRDSDDARVILKGTGAATPVVLLASTGNYDPVDVAGINADGVVAFEALSGGFKGVYRTTDGVTVTPVAVESAGGFAGVEALDINNNGTVVFFTETTTGTGSLNVDTSGTPTLFADTSGPTFESFGPAAVAETGATAFRGIFKQGLDGIFAGGTGLYEKAIALGDGLLGSGVTVLDTGPQAVINNGRFVFRAIRGNGTSGIFVATPRVAGGGGGGGGGGSAFDGLSVAALLLAERARRRRRVADARRARA